MNKINLKGFIYLFIIIHLLLANELSAQTIPRPLASTNQVNDIGQKDSAVSLTPEMIEKIKHMHFNNDLFITNYQILIYNSNVQAACALAKIAVEKRPKDLAWHERLARSATWSGDYNTGMAEWLFVVSHTNDIKLIKEAAAAAKVLGYDDVLVKILEIYLAKNPNDVKENLELAYAQNRLGQPDRALSTLRNINARYPTRDAYVLSATIYQDVNQWGDALKVWQKINKQFKPAINSLMSEAQLYYTQHNFNQALNVLKQGISIAKQSDTDFWDTLGELAWTMNNRRLAIIAYAHNKIDTEHYQRLISLEIKANPNLAFIHSVEGWKRFHNTDFLSTALLVGSQLHKWKTIQEILGNLSGSQLREAQKLQIYWQAQENMYAYYGAEDLSRQVLIRGVMLQPQMIQLKSDLLWMVMGNGENEHVKFLMNLWYKQGYWQDPLLWHAYAEGFSVLNNFNAAISMYQLHLFDNLQDGQVLIDYANLLERARLYEEAYSVRLFLWHQVVNKVKRSPTDQETIETLCQVMPFFVSGTDQVQGISNLLQLNVSDEDINIILNWVVQRSYTDLIAFLKANYYDNRPLPDWAEINLALAKNDLPDLQRILEHTDRQWTRGDRINAAVQLRNIPLALDYAFNELTERPLANEIYREFTQYGVANANYVSVDADFEQFVNVSGPRTKFEARLRLTNEWKIIPYASIWGVKSTDSQSITHVPASDAQLGAKLYEVIERGNVIYNLGYRKDLNNFIFAAVDLNYQLNSRWSADFNLGYNQENFENAFMREGGVQDVIGLGLGYSYNNYDSVFLEAKGLDYYSQDRHYLADGFNLSGLYQHKFWLGYPDYTIGVFGDLHDFDRNGSFGGDVINLFPSLPASQQSIPALVAKNNSANYKNLIPDTYYDAGLIFSFGNTILDYTHAWRPYLWASVYYNSLTMLSYDIKSGLNGSVFGRDSLLFYGEYGTAQTTPNQRNYTIGLRYLIYF